MSVTLSSLPGKFKCSLLNVFFCPDGINHNFGLTGPNDIHIIYIYIYIYAHLHTEIYMNSVSACLTHLSICQDSPNT